ncbi:MAG: alkaline phosphatase [Wenzhouxiangellaceae bacterium]|nr:alkaline phosphatase [Wenzhouxiangellaceae bacterium]
MTQNRPKVRPVLIFVLAALLGSVAAPAAERPTGSSAIFFHPDGTSAGHWDAARILHVGPDGVLNWDRIPNVTRYRGHLVDRIGATSNGGAVTHATGRRAHADSFGLDPNGKEMVSLDGTTRTIVEKAREHGIYTVLIQTGSLVEPGTAAFVAEAPTRYGDYENIARQVAESGVDIHLGAGERWLLPEGVEGRFGPGARTDGRNLIEELEQAGYAVVRSREELLSLPADVDRVFGVFAREDTFNDVTEAELRAAGLEPYDPDAPTVAEMTAFALERAAGRENGFLAIIEEEGTDNLCNKMNAYGCLEAFRRADEAAGVLLEFVEAHPDTFLIAASDSNAGGMQVLPVKEILEVVPLVDARSGSAIDGAEGTGTRPFVSAPDSEGRRFPFAIAWAASGDLGSGVVARAAGPNAEEWMPPTGIDNTDVYRMLHATLFGTWID